MMADEEHYISELQNRMGYSFADKSLLLRSLTHPSSLKLSRQTGHNQRLEFLGDAVLGMILAEWLFQEFPDEREGMLTRYRSMLVNGDQLHQLAIEMDLGSCVRIGESEEFQGGRKRASILEDAFEALIGAIYLDGGLDSVRGVVKKVYGQIGNRLEKQLDWHNPKGKLQEHFQPLADNESIEYRLVDSSGPDHKKKFTVELWVEGNLLSTGSGNSKKIAEEEAARIALEDL